MAELIRKSRADGSEIGDAYEYRVYSDSQFLGQKNCGYGRNV